MVPEVLEVPLGVSVAPGAMCPQVSHTRLHTSSDSEECVLPEGGAPLIMADEQPMRQGGVHNLEEAHLTSVITCATRELLCFNACDNTGGLSLTWSLAPPSHLGTWSFCGRPSAQD